MALYILQKYFVELDAAYNSFFFFAFVVSLEGADNLQADCGRDSVRALTALTL